MHIAYYVTRVLNVINTIPCIAYTYSHILLVCIRIVNVVYDCYVFEWLLNSLENIFEILFAEFSHYIQSLSGFTWNNNNFNCWYCKFIFGIDAELLELHSIFMFSYRYSLSNNKLIAFSSEIIITITYPTKRKLVQLLKAVSIKSVAISSQKDLCALWNNSNKYFIFSKNKHYPLYKTLTGTQIVEYKNRNKFSSHRNTWCSCRYATSTTFSMKFAEKKHFKI